MSYGRPSLVLNIYSMHRADARHEQGRGHLYPDLERPWTVHGHDCWWWCHEYRVLSTDDSEDGRSHSNSRWQVHD